MSVTISLDDLRARHTLLVRQREQGLAQIARLQEEEIGYKYVLGELETMIAALEGEAAANPPPEPPAITRAELLAGLEGAPDDAGGAPI